MVDISTIRTDAYTTMYNLLSDSSIGITNNSNIHSRYNDNNANREGYPQIILNPIIERSSEGFRRSGQWAMINYEIQVWHNSPENARTVADEIDNVIRTNHSTSLANNGIRFNDEEDANESKDEVYAGSKRAIQIITMNFPFRYRQKVN